MHGLTKGPAKSKRKYHPVYKTWQNMIQRCTNPNVPGYKRYGAEGICVCKRWMSSKNFIEDMLPSWFEGATLDRIDNDGDYKPENCQWVTKAENIRKTRRTKFIEFQGAQLSVRQLSQRVAGVSYQTILRRLDKGLSVEEAIKLII